MLIDQIQELKHLAHQLLYLGTDDTPIYADSLAKLNKEVTQKANALFTAKASTNEEEALLCLALLMGYNAVMYSQSEIENRKQAVLDRAGKILDKISPSLLKCQLLTYCYGEVYDEVLRFGAGSKQLAAIEERHCQRHIADKHTKNVDAVPCKRGDRIFLAQQGCNTDHRADHWTEQEPCGKKDRQHPVRSL